MSKRKSTEYKMFDGIDLKACRDGFTVREGKRIYKGSRFEVEQFLLEKGLTGGGKRNRFFKL